MAKAELQAKMDDRLAVTGMVEARLNPLGGVDVEDYVPKTYREPLSSEKLFHPNASISWCWR